MWGPTETMVTDAVAEAPGAMAQVRSFYYFIYYSLQPHEELPLLCGYTEDKWLVKGNPKVTTCYLQNT